VNAPKRVALGKLTGVFGIRGEVKFLPTAFGEHAFAAGKVVAMGSDPDARELRCASVRRHHERLLLAFEGIITPEAAREIVGAALFGDAGEIKLAPGEFLDAELVGMRLVDATGQELGLVVAVQHFPAQDCLVVGTQRALVPMVKAFIKNIDRTERTIATELPEGLLDG
jgi:16S rRNA processing protein RimM